ncbi:MAG: toll/interleukin-1 receptor domain-containing protein, partial [Terricaulis sp.]
MRVLLLYKKAERAVLEAVAYHLTRAGYDTVLDVKPGDHETLLDAAKREVALADRVVIAWSDEVERRGSIFALTELAGRSAKLLILLMDESSVPISGDVARIPLIDWDRSAESPQILALISSLELEPKAIQSQSFELHQSDVHYAEDDDEPPASVSPSPTYVAGDVPPRTSHSTLRATIGELRPRGFERALPGDSDNDGEDDRAKRERDLREMIRYSVGEAPKRAANSIRLMSLADASAFAPRSLRRSTPELIRIVVHRPEDRRAVEKAARRADSRGSRAGDRLGLGALAHGAHIAVTLEVAGAIAAGGTQRREWSGDAMEFSFAVEPDQNVRQVVIFARLAVDDAEVGMITFTRRVTGRTKPDHTPATGIRLKRHKRVFLSYSSQDRESVSSIATAYFHAGIRIFWDRKSLESGEDWPPRIRRELNQCDLFHLCWS